MEIKQKDFIIENGHNTSYLNILFMSLFYSTDRIDKYLVNNVPKTIEGEYLYEIIKNKFINKVTNNMSVKSGDINYVRNISYMMGWLSNSDINILMSLHDIQKYYCFLTEKLELKKIEVYQKQNRAPNNQMSSQLLKNLPYININVTNSMIDVKINDLVNSVICNEENEENKMVIINTPLLLPLFINRPQNNKTRVDIMKKIKIEGKMVDYDGVRWKFLSVICKNSNNGSYYGMTNKCGVPIIFGESLVPSAMPIDINDQIIKNKLMEECVMVFYILCIN